MMKRVTLFVFLFVLFSSSNAQNNSIKVSVFALGESFYTYSIWTAGITYERHLGERHSILLDASFVFNDSGNLPLDGLHTSLRYGGSLSYRYYFVSNKKFLNRFWISPGFRYQNWHFESHNQSSLEKTLDFYGMRFLAGKKSKDFGKLNWHVDFGFGFSYGKRYYSSYESKYRDYETGEPVVITDLPDPYYLFLPELMIRVGIRL